MKTTILYLLKYKDSSCFKIGIASDVFNRAIALGGLEYFNWNESYFLELPSQKDAYKIEQMLHYLHNYHNIDSPDGIKCGLTEWFDITCFDNVLDTLKQFMAKLKLPENKLQCKITPPDKTKLVNTYKNPTMTKEEIQLKYLEEIKIFRKVSIKQVNELIELILSINDYLIEKIYRAEDDAYTLVYTSNEAIYKIALNTIFPLGSFRFKMDNGYIHVINIVAGSSGDNNICKIKFHKLSGFFRVEGFENIKILDDFLEKYADKNQHGLQWALDW